MEREINKKFVKNLVKNTDIHDLELSESASGNPIDDRLHRIGANERQRGPRSAGPSRELNPALFADRGNPSQVMAGALQNEYPHVLQNEQKINEMKNQISVMAEHVGKLSQQFSEWSKSTHTKFERLQSQMTKLEQNDHYIVTEAAQKFSQINTRFGERRSIDIKIQEMIDRHNSVLKSFEMRLSQMQRLMAEKEAQLLATTAALNETKMEISRLKRM
jgi:hypothetical protein